MKLIGLTGGVGMGKSTSAAYLQALQIPLADTDQIARQLVEPGQAALEEIRVSFGQAVLDEVGRLKRDELARQVFAKPDKRKQLEAILHPRIRAVWQTQAQAWREAHYPLGVVVIPLLFETQAAALFETVVCAACSQSTQASRLRNRGWSNEQIEQRRAAQWPVSKKMDESHFVVWTEGSLESHQRQWDRILAHERGR